MKKIVMTLTLLLLFLPAVYGAKNTSFVSYLSATIFAYCKENDIELNHEIVFYNISADFNYSIKLSYLKWPYSDTETMHLGASFIGNEPFVGDEFGCKLDLLKVNCPNGGKPSGYNILRCAGNRLSIYDEEYSWNETKIEVPESWGKNWEVTTPIITNITAENIDQDIICYPENLTLIQNNMSILEEVNTKLVDINNLLKDSKKENFVLSYIYPLFISIILYGIAYITINKRVWEERNIIKLILYFIAFLVISYASIFLIKIFI